MRGLIGLWDDDARGGSKVSFREIFIVVWW